MKIQIVYDVPDGEMCTEIINKENGGTYYKNCRFKVSLPIGNGKKVVSCFLFNENLKLDGTVPFKCEGCIKSRIE